MVVGSQISYLTNSISEPGGLYLGLYEPGETLDITIFSTNDGARVVSNVVNTLTAASAGFTITPASAAYPALTIGASTSTVYQVVIGAGVTNGTYTFYVTNSSGADAWSSNFTFNVFIRQPNSDWVKADNTNNLNLTSSWLVPIVPDSTDRAIFDSTVTAPITTALGANLSWKGIALISNTASWTISGSNTLTTGSAGIDMSQAQANLTIASKMAITATQTWNVATSRTLTVSGSISGTNTAPLTKSGLGTLTLSGTNTYSGGTTISNGTLAVANSSAIGTGVLSMNSSTLATAGTTLLTNEVVLTNSVNINNDNALTLSGAISGSGSLTKTGNGQLFLATTNTYSGGTTNYGFIQIGNPDSLGTGPLVMMSNSTLYTTFPAFSANGPSIPNPIILAGNAIFTNILTQSADKMKIGGNISGPGSLMLGGFQFYLYGSNTFTGDLTLNVNNWLYFDHGGVFGNGTIRTITRGALLSALSTSPQTVTITNPIVMNNAFRVNPLSATRTIVLSGTMSGNGTFQRIDNNAGSLEITGDNSGRTGPTTYQYGVLRLGHENALGTNLLNIAANLNFSLEVLKDLTAGNGVPNAIVISGVADANGVVAPLVFNLEHDLKLSGNISGPPGGLMSIQKNGVGALIITGDASGWVDPFNINAGSVDVTGYLGNPLITANSGTKLQGTGWVQAVTMHSGSLLDLSSGGMTFIDTLTLENGSTANLSVTNTSCALYGSGVNTLSAAGVLRLDFTGNSGATNGAIFTVFNNWGTLTNNGLLTLAFGLPPFLKLDTSNLFVNGSVAIVTDSRVSAHTLEITVPQGGTGSGSIVLSNSTAEVLSYTAKDDGGWPANKYQVTTSSVSVARASFLPAQFSPATTISNWNGNSSPVMNIGFTFPLYGTKYTTFSVNRYGAITLGGATDGANLGLIPSGSNPVIAPFWGSTLINTNSIRYKMEGDHLVVAWNNANGTNKEFQAWIYNDGTIRYLYQFGITGTAGIGVQNGSFSRNLTDSYTPGTTSDGSLLITPKSWVSSAPDTGTLNPGQSQTLTFTADGVGQNVGDYFFTASVHWSDGQSSDIGVFITVTPDTSKLNITPSPLIFSGPAGFITQTNLFVTNSGSAALSYVITDSGLQGAGYAQTNVDYSWFYIPQAANYMLSTNQLGSQSLNIGFPFVFFGNVYTTLTVNANGTLTLGSEQTISPFGAALSLDSNASVRFFADPGLSRFTVTWENIAQSSGGSNQTFQAVLNRDGEILFNYQQLASGWTNGAIRLIDSSGTVSGTLVSASTLVTNVTITPIYSNKVTIVGNVTNIVPEKIGATTNIVTSYTATANLEAIRFTPGQLRIISASPTSGTILGGGSTNIVVTGDARSLTSGGANDITNSTVLTFSYSGLSTNVDVTFIATNSVEGAYPAADVIAQADMWGADPVVNSQQNADGSRTLSWAMANDGLSRTYVVWYSINLMSGWTELYRGDNFYSYTDSQHKDVPVIYYKVTVQ
jgi:autotransporter-associated beta strand protein